MVIQLIMRRKRQRTRRRSFSGAGQQPVLEKWLLWSPAPQSRAKSLWHWCGSENDAGHFPESDSTSRPSAALFFCPVAHCWLAWHPGKTPSLTRPPGCPLQCGKRRASPEGGSERWIFESSSNCFFLVHLEDVTKNTAVFCQCQQRHVFDTI